MPSREQVFDALLSSLGSSDPLGSVISRSARLCHGSGLVINELGEVSRVVGAAPGHLIAEWVQAQAVLGTPANPAATTHPAATAHPDATTPPLETAVRAGQIGRWTVRARSVRIRQREHALVIAVLQGPVADSSRFGRSGAVGPERKNEDVVLVLDTAAKILQAFEGFESFSMSTRREESARLIRTLTAGVTPGREPAIWTVLENFGFEPYTEVRIVRVRVDDGPGEPADSSPDSQALTGSKAVTGRGRTPGDLSGIVFSDSGVDASAREMTALVDHRYPLESLVADSGSAAGASEPFTALSQVPEMMRTADVALSAAEGGECVRVDRMRPVEWAAARMSSRFDRTIARSFLETIAQGSDAWLTLTTYLDCGANVAEAARRLTIHENTVRYRLGQIETVIGARLSDPRVTADIVLALECRRQAERR